MSDQVCQDLGIGLGSELMTMRQQLIPEGLEILNYTVVNKSQFA